MTLKTASVLNFITTLHKITPQANCKRICDVKVDPILNGRRNRGISNSGKPYIQTIRILNKILTPYGLFYSAGPCSSFVGKPERKHPEDQGVALKWRLQK
jgi:hypothetical protein